MQRYFKYSWLAFFLISSTLLLPVQAQSTSSTSGQKLERYVPKDNEINLLLKVGERRVYVYRGKKLIKKYRVAVGKKGWETPTGDWKVRVMAKNPGWVSFKTGESFPPGPDNPLGERWIGFWLDDKTQDEIGFHGTTNLASIGKAASHGCVRMSNEDVKVLYKLVQVGTLVRVRS